MWPLKTSKHELAAAATHFFSPPSVFKDGGKERKKKKKKANFNAIKLVVSVLCGMAQQPGKRLLLSVTPGLCST